MPMPAARGASSGALDTGNRQSRRRSDQIAVRNGMVGMVRYCIISKSVEDSVSASPAASISRLQTAEDLVHALCGQGWLQVQLQLHE